ncbi:MAG: hypothetical protein OEO21_11535 [Candidatus Krumholzibacteria bacterium]|nr:hypothetical protein [Candidatus Krumholzibacteria bacterium]
MIPGRRAPFTRYGLLLLCAGWLVFAGPSCDEESPAEPEVSVADAGVISMARRRWVEASPPLVPIVPPTQVTRLDPADRAAIDWYNLEPQLATTRRDLDPTVPWVYNTLVTALDIDLESAPASADTWVGVMQGFPGSPGRDLADRRYLVIWINDFKPDPSDRGGFVHIDIGRMDENFYEPEQGEFQDEDQGRDGFVVAWDDRGLDGLFDEDEPGYNPNRNPDPNGDDLNLNRINGRFSKVNGTEGNHSHDTEDLDRNGQFDRSNAYFTFTIDLANDVPLVDIRAAYPDYDGFNDFLHHFDSWRMYIFALSHAVVVSDSDLPSWSEVRHIRIWFEDVGSVVPSDSDVVTAVGRRIQIAQMKFID